MGSTYYFDHVVTIKTKDHRMMISFTLLIIYYRKNLLFQVNSFDLLAAVRSKRLTTIISYFSSTNQKSRKKSLSLLQRCVSPLLDFDMGHGIVIVMFVCIAWGLIFDSWLGVPKSLELRDHQITTTKKAIWMFYYEWESI